MPDAAWQTIKPTIRHRYELLLQSEKSPEAIREEVYADITKTMPAEQLKDLNTVQQISGF